MKTLIFNEGNVSSVEDGFSDEYVFLSALAEWNVKCLALLRYFFSRKRRVSVTPLVHFQEFTKVKIMTITSRHLYHALHELNAQAAEYDKLRKRDRNYPASL